MYKCTGAEAGRRRLQGLQSWLRGVTRPTAADDPSGARREDEPAAGGVRFHTTRLVASETIGGVTTGCSEQWRLCDSRDAGGRLASKVSVTASRAPVRRS